MERIHRNKSNLRTLDRHGTAIRARAILILTLPPYHLLSYFVIRITFAQRLLALVIHTQDILTYTHTHTPSLARF